MFYQPKTILSNMIQPFSYYDKIILSFSGGKDSIACFLYLLECGVPLEKIELWHQYIDGYGLQEIPFFDWRSTHGYVEAFANHFGVKLEKQWRDGGFYREMMRNNQRTGDVYFTRNDQVHYLPTTKGNPRTRMMWPAVSSDLNARWCSGYLKIDVAARALANTEDLKDKRILFITGERREESVKRSKYKEYEFHRTNSKSRLVHHWRIIIDMTERTVWDLMEKHGIIAHPAYFLGLSRLSCRKCIFFSPDHWATLLQIDPREISSIDKIEKELDFTLYHKKEKGRNVSISIWDYMQKGKSLITPENTKYIPIAMSDYNGPITTNNWILPTGAFGSGGGAT